MIYGVNDAKIILLKFVFIEAVLIPAFPGTEIVSIITFPILRILLFPSVLELIKFSTVENLIKAKITKDCNIVHNDCAIAFESWSGYLMKNRPAGDNNNFGILISFNYPRKTQLYISGGSMYTRVNQGTEDYNSWSLWLRCSN